MIVIDASALVELLLGGSPRAAKLAMRIGANTTLHAPQLIDLEVTSVLRSLEARRVLTPAAATRAVVDLLALDVTRYAHEPLVPRIWQLRGHMTVSDASYVSLAETLGVPLVTCDAGLAKAPGHRAHIDLVP